MGLMPKILETDLDHIFGGGDKYLLIGHRICPYVQRVVIALKENGFRYKTLDIDIDAKPNWIQKVSPASKVPVLIVDGEFSIFESSVICDYLDRIGGRSLCPDNDLQVAVDKSWMAYAGTILDQIAQIIYRVKDDSQLDTSLKDISDSLDKLENVTSGPYLFYDRFTMIDVMYAPIFRYIRFFSERLGTDIYGLRYKVRRWAMLVLRRNSVIEAVPESYEEELVDFIGKRNEFIFSKVS